jgi:L-asparaginase
MTSFFALVCLLFVLTPAAAAQSAATAPASPSQAVGVDLPHVHMLATGGTISNRAGGRLTADELAKSMPGLESHARLTYEQFANVASSQLTLAQWLALSRRVNELFAGDKALACVVVTSGTDTLEETAFFLHLTVKDVRPVVVVGSMRNPSTLGYEGAANLLDAIRVAADPSSRDKGALVVLNDEINSARDVTKTDALRLQTFASREYGKLGVVDQDRVFYGRMITHRHTSRSEFEVNAIKELPRVDVIVTYQGASGDLIKAAVDAGAKGIVLATAGAGATSGTQTEGLDYAAEKGVFIAAAPPRLHRGGRRSRADQGARAVDACAHPDAEPRRHSTHLHRVLTARIQSTISAIASRRVAPRSVSDFHVGKSIACATAMPVRGRRGHPATRTSRAACRYANQPRMGSASAGTSGRSR